MTNQAKHTPIPWNSEETDIIAPIVEGRAGESRIGETLYSDDAKFIVKAVNCHEELLGALKECHRYVGVPCPIEVSNKIKAVIAQAEGRIK